MKRSLSLLLVMILLFSVFVPTFALAEDGEAGTGDPAAGQTTGGESGDGAEGGNTGYGYTIRVFAGNMGKVDGGDVVTVADKKAYGSEWGFDIGTVQVTNEKYYVKGIRESGLDNDAVSNPAGQVTRDVDYVVAYGVKGNEVAYTVSFVRDSNGAALAPSVTYYGNVGDKPVVACKFIDGYTPRYYNITGTLSENAASNQFVFRYAPTPASGTETVVIPGGQIPAQNIVNPNAANNANQNAANAGQGTGGDAGTGAGDSSGGAGGGDAFPAQPENILDMDVPLADAESQGGEKEKLPGWIVLLLALAAAGLISIPFVVRQLRKNGKNEEADQLEKAYEEELKKKEDKK